MAPIYDNSFRGDDDIINCLNSLRLDSQPNPAPNSNAPSNSNAMPHSNPLHNRNEVIEIFSSDEEEESEVTSSEGDELPNDATCWVEYNEQNGRQAHAERMGHRKHQSLGSTDEYPDPEFNRLIATVDLHTLDGPQGESDPELYSMQLPDLLHS
jgi:hypothetical protein